MHLQSYYDASLVQPGGLKMPPTDPRGDYKNRIKSRIGEALVESLLEEAGNKVRRFGQEWRTTACEEPSQRMFTHVELPEKVRCKPDFVIRNRQHKIETVEVKFMLTDSYLIFLWAGSTFSLLKKHWPKTRIIVVNTRDEPLIRVIDPPYAEGEHGTEVVTGKPIHEIAEWGVTEELAELYGKLIGSFSMEELKIRKERGGS